LAQMGRVTAVAWLPCTSLPMQMCLGGHHLICIGAPVCLCGWYAGLVTVTILHSLTCSSQGLGTSQAPYQQAAASLSVGGTGRKGRRGRFIPWGVALLYPRQDVEWWCHEGVSVAGGANPHCRRLHRGCIDVRPASLLLADLPAASAICGCGPPDGPCAAFGSLSLAQPRLVPCIAVSLSCCPQHYVGCEMRSEPHLLLQPLLTLLWPQRGYGH
jgi:hypothetical protein